MKVKLKQIVLLFLLFFGLIEVRAQKAVVPVGGSTAGSGGSMSYTVGQVVYTTASGSNGSANQGVQQPYEIYIVGIGGNEEVNLQIVVYPNPATSKVSLNTGSLDPDNLTYLLYDSYGKLLKNQKIRDKLTEIPLEDLPAAVYILKVLNRDAEARVFKIIKK